MDQSPGPFDCISPIDFRYWEERAAEFLSENASTRYKLRVELALVTVLCQRGLCNQSVVDEVAAACAQVTTEEVYTEERKTHHDIRALVNCIQRRVSEQARPIIHLGATSYDIVDTANACRYRDAVRCVLLPLLLGLESVLIEITEREADTLQISRTHGQHAVPITFGFAMAEYVSRLGGCIVELEQLARLMSEIVTVCGVMANLADDMRHLQRTEISEVGEEFTSDQVGSSTMPQKRNPINFENVKSIWKVVVAHIITVFMDQISEHQRDLTNSASGRTRGEIIAYTIEMAARLKRTMIRLRVDEGNLAANLARSQGGVLAEPMYLILASLGHPDAHEAVKQMTLTAQRDGKSLAKVFAGNTDLAGYREQLTDEQRHVLSDPAAYTGRAAERARQVATIWREQIAKTRAKLA